MSAGRRRPRRRGRRRGAGRPIASGVCSGLTVSMWPTRTPSAIRNTRSAQIAVPPLVGELAAGTRRVDALPEQHLGPVDVAHARDDRLVHQQRPDGGAAAADPRQAASGSASARSGSGPSLACSVFFPDGSSSSQVLGPRRSAYSLRVAQAQPHQSCRRRRRRRAEGVLAVDAPGARGATARRRSPAAGVAWASASVSTRPSIRRAPAANRPGALGVHRPPAERPPVLPARR